MTNNVRSFPWEYEHANRLIDDADGEYAPDALIALHAAFLAEQGDPLLGAALYETRARQTFEVVERGRALRHDGQRALFDADAVLPLGDGRHIRLGLVEDRAQLDRAHAHRTRQIHGQTTAYSAWTESYLEWTCKMDETGLPLSDAIALTESEAATA